MVKNKVYTDDKIQLIKEQFEKDPHSIVWSDDGGATWNELTSLDSVNIRKRSIIDGEFIKLIYKLK